MLERCQSLLRYHFSIADLCDGYSADHGPHNPQKLVGDLLPQGSAGMCETERNRQVSEWFLLVEAGAKLSETLGTVEELSTWHDERTMTGGGRRRREREAHNVRRVSLDWSYPGDCSTEPTTGNSSR